jgi:hypothetical protein
MANEPFGQTVTGWHQLSTSLEANAADLSHLESRRVRLAELFKLAQDLNSQQAALTASKQEVTKRLQEVLDEGRKIATFLRVGVKQHYGRRSEKVVEFGLRPFRGLRRPAEPQTPSTNGAGAPASSSPSNPRN